MPVKMLDDQKKRDEAKVRTATKGDKLRKDLKKAVSKKTSDNPMKMERKKEGFRSKNPGVKFMDEMDAMTKGLKTLTSEGPGRLKVGSFSKGGRAGYKMGGKCKIAKKGKGRAYGKNS
tara:strand:+ start:41 stop:394 length:354 start_codon:yes stop_codon:yes gene_type:complete